TGPARRGLRLDHGPARSRPRVPPRREPVVPGQLRRRGPAAGPRRGPPRQQRVGRRFLTHRHSRLAAGLKPGGTTMSWKPLTTGAALAVAAIALAGCAAAPSDARTTLTVSIDPGLDKGAIAAFDARIKQFEAANSGIDV